MTGPVSQPPPSGPGRTEAPLDPTSPRGRDVARRLTAVLTEIEMELAQQDAASAEIRSAA